MRVTGWLIIGGAGAGLLTYLLLPLFRGRSGAPGLRSRFRLFVGHVVRLRHCIRSLLHRAGARLAAVRRHGLSPLLPRRRAAHAGGRKVDFQGDREQVSAGSINAAESAERRLTAAGIRKSFRRFIRFGERHGVKFSYAMAPGEYVSKVAGLIPEHAGECREIADLFEEAIYSNHDLDEQFGLRFKRVVKITIRNSGSGH
jgi:hypothetical protein